MAEITRCAEIDGVGMKTWMRDALLGAARVTLALHKARQRQARWTPIKQATAGMTEITASLADSAT